MAVNVSDRQLIEPGFSVLVAQVIAQTGIDPETLFIEVTETAVINRRETAIANLESMRRQGVHISLDDFGTGYASLSYLRDLPITHIKIDRSFTAGLTTDPHDATIIESTIDLAHGLGRSVIAEGVETADQLKLLKGFGCDEAQGFYLGHPQPADEIDRICMAGTRTPAPGIR